MYKEELIQLLAEKTGGTISDAEIHLTALTDIISRAQAKGDDILCLGTRDQRLEDALMESHRKWFDYETRSLKPEIAEIIPCPACGSGESSSAYLEKDWFHFVKCKKCTMVYLNPRPNVKVAHEFYNSPWQRIYYEQRVLSPNSDKFEIPIHLQENIDLIERYSPARRISKGTLLEIGIGTGDFLRTAKRNGYNVWGVDVCNEFIEHVNIEFYGQVENCDLFSAGFDSNKFDVVYMRDVFEHLPNPRSILDEINRISKEGATLYIEVPNIDGIIYKLVGKRHIIVFGFQHLNYWTPQSITHLLASAGYDVDYIKHTSGDCTLCDALEYFLFDSLTTVFKKSKSRYRLHGRVFRILISYILKMPRLLERMITPRLANFLKRGSVIQVLASKRS